MTTYFFALLIPLIFILSFAFASFRKVRVYESFTNGVKGAIPLVVSIFPYIAAVTMMTKLLEISGLGASLTKFLLPVFTFMGVPEEIAPILLIKPLSGSGSIAALSQVLETCGVDSYAARCACVVCGSSDTVFYIGAVYFAGLKRKNLTKALFIALAVYILSIPLGCFLCSIL